MARRTLIQTTSQFTPPALAIIHTAPHIVTHTALHMAIHILRPTPHIHTLPTTTPRPLIRAMHIQLHTVALITATLMETPARRTRIHTVAIPVARAIRRARATRPTAIPIIRQGGRATHRRIHIICTSPINQLIPPLSAFPVCRLAAGEPPTPAHLAQATIRTGGSARVWTVERMTHITVSLRGTPKQSMDFGFSFNSGLPRPVYWPRKDINRAGPMVDNLLASVF